MKFVRLFLIIYALLYVLGAIFLFRMSKSIGMVFPALYLLISGLVLLSGVLFERGRYKSKNLPKEGWQSTNERFIDHTTGKLMEVRYNSQTGERDYVEVNPKL